MGASISRISGIGITVSAAAAALGGMLGSLETVVAAASLVILCTIVYAVAERSHGAGEAPHRDRHAHLSPERVAVAAHHASRDRN